MLSFLAPAALAGAVLLAIPIAIHLFKPRKVRVTNFSSLRWLNLSKQKLARRIQWHQLLLFFVRAAFVLLLVLALAKPLFTPGGRTAGVDRFIVLDVSRSMGYSQAQQDTPLDRAKAVAEHLLSHGKADDRVTLLLTADRTRALGQLAKNGQSYVNQLAAITPSQSRTDLSSALRTIKPMLPAASTGRSAEIHFLTDNHQQAWNQGTIHQFTQDAPVPVRAQLVDVSTPDASNVYIAQMQHITQPSQATGQPENLLRVTVGYAGLNDTSRRVQLDALDSQPVQSKAVDLTAGQSSVVEFPLPAELSTTADQPLIARVTLDPSDGLAKDDIAWLALDAQATTRVLLVDNQPAGQDASRNQTLHLQAALRALGAASRGRLQITHKTMARLLESDLAQAQVIIMANVPSFTSTQYEALRQRVAAGAGLAVFLGPQVDVNYYNSVLHNAAGADQSILPVTLGQLRTAAAIQGRLPGMTDVNWRAPLLDSLYDPVLGDLPQTRFFQHFELEPDAAADPPPAVLARIGGQSPAIIQSRFGAGKVVLLNTTADDSWSDLPRRKSFVPLVDKLISHLAGGEIRSRFEVNTPIAIMLPDGVSTSGDAWHVAGPAGDQFTATSQAAGTRTLLRLDGVPQPGVYEVQDDAGKTITRFIAFASLDDSRLVTQDTQTLTQWWEPMPLNVLTPDAAMTRFSQETATLRLWPWLIALGALLLALEMFLVHKLCPKMNPKLADSVVHSQGRILAPARPTQPSRPTPEDVNAVGPAPAEAAT